MKTLATTIFLTPLLACSALANGDPEDGERVFRKCSSCHSLEQGQRKAGPSLYGVVGSRSGTVEGFKYSDANLNADVVWTEENLAAFLADPRGFMPGTRMIFRGLRDEEDIKDLIAYLALQSQ